MSNKAESQFANKDRALQLVLNREFDRIRLKNPSYSLRAFAKKLSIAPSALSEILQGKRGVSRKAAFKIATHLSLAPNERDRLLSRFPEKRGAIVAVRSTQLVMDQYRMISEWYHFAILSLAETQTFASAPDWVARRLGVSKTIARAAIDRLVRLKMLNRSEAGELAPTGHAYSSPDDIATLSLRKAHATNLDLAKNSLETDSIEMRDFTSITMAIDPAKVPEAKKRIRRFQNELCAYLESGEKTEVYKICTQFFPLSKNGDSDV